jgi:hypothetical protein
MKIERKREISEKEIQIRDEQSISAVCWSLDYFSIYEGAQKEK